MMKSVAARRRGDEQRGRGEGRERDVEGSGRREGSPLFSPSYHAASMGPLIFAAFASASLYRHFILLRLIAAIKHYTETLQRKRRRGKERQKEKEKERERKSRENRPDLTIALHCPFRVYTRVHMPSQRWISTIYIAMCILFRRSCSVRGKYDKASQVTGIIRC